MDWLTFVSGVAIGVVGKVVADWWTDRRRGRSQRTEAKQRFARVEAAMPALLNEMKADLDGDSLVREFVTLPSQHNVFNHGGTNRFEYYEEDHPDLASKLAMLENSGYIRDVRVYQNAPIYRMTEEFVQLLGSGVVSVR